MHLSGERVSNTWVTCLGVWDNGWKRPLIPDGLAWSQDLASKGFGRTEIGPRLISLLVR